MERGGNASDGSQGGVKKRDSKKHDTLNRMVLGKEARPVPVFRVCFVSRGREREREDNKAEHLWGICTSIKVTTMMIE